MLPLDDKWTTVRHLTGSAIYGHSYAGFFPKKLVSFCILDVSTLSIFCAPREDCASAFRFLLPSVSLRFAVDELAFVIGFEGKSWARIESTYLFNTPKLKERKR